ncbi:iron ABC transporter permease [Paenibacillus sp. LHD-38]|uniref:FecCD family ABC transporter permease n=1 Tax=Paenibacillus sp. LHD-38 TaxID=3072143 RepID=UPI00280DDC4F|nr:iron ABC transporter permease [Paenibacillus sp. LHD-38]MDQ8737683.1 iron ABC transporter permease [Paenibacillus sp. LHD-38]
MKKKSWIAYSLAAACVATAVISVCLGDTYISPFQVFQSFAGKGSDTNSMIIEMLRLPRITTALLVGASLAVAGSILQGIVRNPMASPEMLGVTGGASAAAVAFLTFAAGTVSIRWLPVSALAGAGAVSLVLYLFAWKRGVTSMRLILIGVGMSALMSGATTMMIVFNPKNDAGQAYTWLTGSVYAANWENVLLLLPWTIILMPLTMLMTRHVNIAQLGDDIATSSGSRVQLNRFILLMISVALAGSAVSVGGGIGFVGLLAPHMARKLIGANFKWVMPVSAMLGAIIVMLADLIGRTAFLPLDVPAGVFTAAIGAPFFIYLLYARRNES